MLFQPPLPEILLGISRTDYTTNQTGAGPPSEFEDAQFGIIEPHAALLHYF